MCGIVGIVADKHVNQDCFDALTALQHRGQDAAGVATWYKKDYDRVEIVKGSGLVRDVIRTRHMYRLQGHMGIGHVRYPTAGSFGEQEAQPFYVNSPYGITLAHNGNLTNTKELYRELTQQDCRHLNTGSDSEILLNVFADALQQQNILPTDIKPEHVFKAVAEVHRRCRGAYAVVAMIAGVGIVAFRDPYGIRPLILGKRDGISGQDYVVASESVALNSLDCDIVGDVAPGEAVFITVDRQCTRHVCADHTQLSPCLFEFVYLARPDSTMDNISVYKVRLMLGRYLAKHIKQHWSDIKFDVVMPIPDTSRTAAAVVARELGKKFREGFVKNRYIGRTFIMPGQTIRRKSVRQKLNTIDLEFANKCVLLIDDSIVRGTTAGEIVQMARDAGAKKVYFASASPQVKFPNVYGIDMPVRDELIAHGRTDQDICQQIGADGLIFLSLDNLVSAVKEGNPTIERFEDSVFTGDYITDDIDDNYLEQLEQSRNNQSRESEA